MILPRHRATTAIVCALVAVLVQLGAHAQQPKPNPNPNPQIKVPPPTKDIKVFWPDLKVGEVKIVSGKATVTVTNACKGKAAATTLELQLYKDPAKAADPLKKFEFNVPAIDAGKSSTQVFDVSSLSGVESLYYRIEVDPKNKVKEAVETNNWSEKTKKPFPDPANACDAK